MAGPLTIVVLGHTGVGKSATGNTILGRDQFESRRSFRSVTNRISEAAGSVFGIQVSVIDTPGILCQGSQDEIRSFCQQIRGPCLFLVVLKVDRFTEEQERAVQVALDLVGQQRTRQAYLLFTWKDALGGSLDDFIYEEPDCPLPRLVDQFRPRYMAFDNQNRGPQQVRELLEMSGHLEAVSDGLERRRVVLLGMCGAGKSSSGNTLLGGDRFRAASGFEAVTAECERRSAVVEGRVLEVLDTPGLNDRSVPPDELAERIGRALLETGPEVHAFVIVVKLDRVSEAESRLLRLLPELFGQEAARYTMVLFTYGDELRGEAIDDKILASPLASELVAMCAGRFCVFNNNQMRDREQVRSFMSIVEDIVAANGGQPCRSASVTQSLEPRSRQPSLQPLSLEETPGTPGEPETWWEWFKAKLRAFIEWLHSIFSCNQTVSYQRLASY